MAKVTNFSGQPLYNQQFNLLDRQKICKNSHETPKRTRSFIIFFLKNSAEFQESIIF